MKTEKILERFAKYLFITVAIAYFGSLITSYETLWIWIGVSGLLLASNVVEYYLRTRPTLLTKQQEILAKRLENTQIEANEVEQVLLFSQEVESENENLKATLKSQEAEVDRIEKAYSKLEAKLESLEAEKSDLKKEISELEAKLSESEAKAKQWAAEKSQAQLDNQKLLKVIKENAEHSRTIEADLQANNSFLEAKQSQYAQAISDLIDKFGYRILTNQWESFKGGMIVLTNKYNTHRLNAIQREHARQELMLTAESVATFAEFLPQEAEVLETLNGVKL